MLKLEWLRVPLCVLFWMLDIYLSFLYFRFAFLCYEMSVSVVV
jgi:hypothetical protein